MASLCSSISTAPVNPYECFSHETGPLVVPADLAIGAEGWTIAYDLTPDDVAAWSLHATCTSTSAGRATRTLHFVGMIAVVVPLLWITVLFKLVPLEGFQAALLGIAIFITLFGSMAGTFLVYVWMLQRYKEEFYRQPENASQIGPRRLVLLPEGPQITAPHSQTTFRWEGITRIECLADTLYLRCSDLSALIVPKRAFADDVLFRQFAKAAVEFHGRARG
jgi:hypothetical protein